MSVCPLMTHSGHSGRPEQSVWPPSVIRNRAPGTARRNSQAGSRRRRGRADRNRLWLGACARGGALCRVARACRHQPLSPHPGVGRPRRTAGEMGALAIHVQPHLQASEPTLLAPVAQLDIRALARRASDSEREHPTLLAASSQLRQPGVLTSFSCRTKKLAHVPPFITRGFERTAALLVALKRLDPPGARSGLP